MVFPTNRIKLFRLLGITAGFNTIIALFLTHIGFGGGFTVNFALSQSIGLCICSAILAGHYLVPAPSAAGHALMVMTSMVIGATAGSLLGSLIVGFTLGETLRGRSAVFFQMLFMGILFGAPITYYFFSRKKISQTEALLQKEQIRRLTLEKQAIEIRLRLLQAQIEPHFLFNTLSNILSLLETDPVLGRRMMGDLTRYLRATLMRTREESATLGQEMELVQAYLDIHKVRMGERLRYGMKVPAHLRERAFPPMLIQPLVENAVKHGLGPLEEGGEISIAVDETPHGLRLAISDTGRGLREGEKTGIGLANVRERLESLFDGKGKITLEENRPSGLKVILEIPHEDEGDHSRG